MKENKMEKRTKRKTMNVQKIKKEANRILRESRGERGKGIREGVAVLLEHILMETKNYRGFNYLRVEDVPHGELVGCYPKDENDLSKGFVFPDESRRHYY